MARIERFAFYKNIKGLSTTIRGMIVLSLNFTYKTLAGSRNYIDRLQSNRRKIKRFVKDARIDIIEKKEKWIVTTGYADMADMIVEKELKDLERGERTLVDETDDLRYQEDLIRLIKRGRLIVNQILDDFDNCQIP